MGALGSAAAVEAADVILMEDELSRIVDAIKIAKETLRVVSQNITFAMVVKVLILILAAVGYFGMWEAILAEVGVMFVVILNAGCSGSVEKGLEYLEAGEFESAAEEFQAAAEKDKDAAEAFRGLGIAKWELEDYEGARDAFKSALDNGAEKTGTLYNFIGCCDLRLGDPSSALNYFNLGISQEGNSKELLQEMKFNVIAAYEGMEDFESAKTKLKEYLEEYPDDEQAQKEMTFLETR